MIPELGHFALILALCLSGLLMAMGGAVAVFDTRYRRLRKRLEVAAAAVAVA